MAGPGGVVEEPGLLAAGHLFDELLAVLAPILIQIADRGQVDLVDLFDSLLALHAMDVVMVEPEFLHHLEPGRD